MGNNPERERLVKAHAWLRLFGDGRMLNGCNEEGVWFDRAPQKRADGSVFSTTAVRSWKDVDLDLKSRGVEAPNLTRGELAAKRALGLVVALLIGCVRP